MEGERKNGRREEERKERGRKEGEEEPRFKPPGGRESLLSSLDSNP